MDVYKHTGVFGGRKGGGEIVRIARMPCVLVARFSGLPGDSSLQGAIRNRCIRIYTCSQLRTSFFLSFILSHLRVLRRERVPVPAAYFAGLYYGVRSARLFRTLPDRLSFPSAFSLSRLSRESVARQVDLKTVLGSLVFVD